MPVIFAAQTDLTIYVVCVIFIATLIRSAFGFGEALISVPLLAMRMPLKTAAPLAVMLSITVAAVIVVQDWKQVHARSAAWLLLATLFGIPPGLMLLCCPQQQMVRLILALVIVLFALYSLARPPLRLRTDHKTWLAICGFFAGILGGAYGMNGPPLAIYGTMRGWSPQQFRATLQGYFLPASLLGMAGYLVKGLWSHDCARYYLVALPAAIPAIWLGRLANRRLPTGQFRKYVYAGLIIIGVVLAIQAFGAAR
ncbi:MAG: sulfite exporter TauE/SafE family protein [Limisphaerales bacterium]